MYQILMLVVPLLLSKYVTSIFTKDVLGVYSYSYSIANNFVIIGMLGIQKYGTRIIAQSKINNTALRKTFWSLLYVHLIGCCLSLFTYFVMCTFIQKNIYIFLIQGLFVASIIFDITWLFYGLEDFRSVVLKNGAVKILEIVLIVAFVKTNSDLWKYTLIMSGSVLLGQVVMIPQAIKLIKPITVSKSDMIKHLKPMLILSISVIATSIYASIDKTILGLLSEGKEGSVAIYDYSEKIIKIPLTIIASTGTVMLPRMSALLSQKETAKARNYISNSVIIISMLAIGAAFGISSISRNFVTLWYGTEYNDCINTIVFLSPLIFLVSFGDIIRSQYLIPQNKDKEFTISVVCGSLLNLVLNIVLIPLLDINGAILSTLIAETIICLGQFFIARKELPIGRYLLEPIPFVSIGLVMILINNTILTYLGIRYLCVLCQIVVGGIVYLVLSLIYIWCFKKELRRSIQCAIKK